ncbi:hypothetical protein [Nocardia sp. IFM 10818]
MKQRFAKWKNSVSGSASDRAIAQRMGTNNTKVARHLNESDPPVAETVIEFARAYAANPVLGLIAAGLVTLQEVEEAASDAGVCQATSQQLLEELLKREKGGARAAR